MGHRISLSPGQNFAFSFSLNDWAVSVNDFDMIVERDITTNGHVLVTFKRKQTPMEVLAIDWNRVLADKEKLMPGEVNQPVADFKDTDKDGM